MRGHRPQSDLEQKFCLPEIRDWVEGQVSFIWDVTDDVFDELNGDPHLSFYSGFAEQAAKYAAMSVIGDDFDFDVEEMQVAKKASFSGRRLFVTAVISSGERGLQTVLVRFNDETNVIYASAEVSVRLRGQHCAMYPPGSAEDRRAVHWANEPRVVHLNDYRRSR